MKQCSTRYLSCLSTEGKIKTTYINNIVGNLKNDQEPRLTDLVSHQLLANHVVGNHLQYQLDTADQLILPVLRLIEPNDVVVGHFDPHSIENIVGDFVDQYTQEEVDVFLKTMRLDRKATMLKQDSKTVFTQWVMDYLNHALIKMRDNYLTELMGGP